jgi:hypothetical protein
MSLEQVLASLPVEQWQTRQAIIWDWFDGPREGVCALRRPHAAFWFELLDERPTADDLDYRMFRVSEIAPDQVDAIQTLLPELGHAAGPVWVPVWQFATDAARQRAEVFIHTVQAHARPTATVIATRDMAHFLGCWEVPREQHPGADWFAALGIAE